MTVGSSPVTSRARQILISAVAVALVAGLPVQRSIAEAAESSYAKPTAPGSVAATPVKSGIRVSWTPVSASPEVTNYIVHAGQGSCPIIVGKDVSSAVLPIVKGQRVVTPQVQAVNAYGISPSATGPTVNAANLVTSRFQAAQFLLLSDFHGAVNESRDTLGAAKLVAAFRQSRSRVRPTFTVSAGDNFGGSPAISSLFDERPAVQALNLMKVDVSTVGNHEHDRPVAHLRQMIDLSEFQWVAANYNTLAPLTGKANRVTPYTILNRDGLSVGFVGMNTEETSTKSDPANLVYDEKTGRRLVVSPSTNKVQRAIDAARDSGAEVVVAVTHQGFDVAEGGQAVGRLIEVAEELRGVGLVVGGHSHQEYASIINDVLVVQTKKSGAQFAQIQLCRDTKSGRVVGSQVEFVSAQAIAGVIPDRRAVAMINGYAAQLASRLDVKLAQTDGIFTNSGTSAIEEMGEVPFGTYTAEAIRAKYGTDVVILNRGGFRDSVPAAGYSPVATGLRRPGQGGNELGPFDVVVGDVLTAYPFDNTVMTSVMTGAQIWGALENGVNVDPTAGKFPQVAGLRFTYDDRRPPGSRLVTVTRADGTPIAPDAAEYSVATIDFMMGGGNGYKGFFNPSRASNRDPIERILYERLRLDSANSRTIQVNRPDGRATNLAASEVQ